MTETVKRDPEALMNVAEVAEFLNASEAFVRQHARGFRQPVIPSVKIGKSVRFRRRAILRFVKSMERERAA